MKMKNPETSLIKANLEFGPELLLVRSFSYAVPLTRKSLSQQQRFESWVCPVVGAGAKNVVPEGQSSTRDGNVAKYVARFEGRDPALLCKSKTNGMWHSSVIHVTRSKYDKIGQMFGLNSKPHIVFDFGGGCGNELAAMKAINPEMYTTGCDYVPQAVQYALKHNKVDKMCSGDCGNLSYIPDGSIDFVLSNAVLYHWNHKPLIDILKNQILRVLRVHGCTWHGWMVDHNPDYYGNWTEAFKGWPVVWQVMTEFDLFGNSEYGTSKSSSIIMCKTGDFTKP